MGPSKKRKVARSESQTGPRKRANRPSTTSSATSPRRGDAPGNHSRPVRACRSNVKYNCSPDVDGESSELSSEPPSGAEEDAEALDPEVSDTYQPSSRPSSNAGEDVEDFDMGTIADDMESASASDEIMLDEDKEGYEVDLPAESFMTNKDLNTKGKPTAGKRPRLSTKASSGKPRKSGWTYKKGINVDLPPLCDISEIFADLTRKAIDKLGLQTALNFLGDKKLRIGTMCSGTESPLLALGLVGD
ncbi:hypothetical protein MMC20_000980, partial [Loxospora ochrophaea]|nr:hypothetical protein [Loxospora ochrophaea]